MQTISIVTSRWTKGPYPATAAGLKDLVDTKVTPLKSVIVIKHGLESDDAVINFMALCHKSAKHLNFILNVAMVVPNPPRSIAWRRWWRNTVDSEHNEGKTLSEVVNDFAKTAGLESISISKDGTEFEVDCRLGSSDALAAAAARLVNMVRWCDKWTQSIKLVSPLQLSWDSFNKISVYGERVIQKKPKIKPAKKPAKATTTP